MVLKKHILSSSFILLLAAVILSCEDTSPQGAFSANEAPNTFLTVDNIDRSGDDRLISQIHINWWGDDPDGYVEGFELEVNNSGEWVFTESNDSTFILPIPFGQDTADVSFRVRAIDNEGDKDESPAELVFPIKNSEPTITIQDLESVPDTTYEVFGFGWTAYDPDGEGNLDITEIAFNDTLGTWTQLPVNEDFINFDFDPTTGQATMFYGSAYRNSGLNIEGINVNAENTFYVRTRDKAGRYSTIERRSWYVKERQSRVLYLHDDDLSQTAEHEDFIVNTLAETGVSVDVWNISDGTVERGRKVPLSKNFPPTIDPTLQMALAEWDYIVWYSNNLDRNLTYAQEITSEFADNGGKILIISPMKSLSDSDPLFNYLPVGDLGQLPELGISFLISRNKVITPVEEGSNLPELKVTENISDVNPIEESSGSLALYETDFRYSTILGFSQDYTGIEHLVIQNPEGNMIFVGFDILKANGNNNIDQFLRAMCIDQLGFSTN